MSKEDKELKNRIKDEISRLEMEIKGLKDTDKIQAEEKLSRLQKLIVV